MSMEERGEKMELEEAAYEEETEKMEEQLEGEPEETEEDEHEEEHEQEETTEEGDIDFSVPFVPKKIKKPCSAWIIYSNENRERVKAMNPTYGFKDMASALSAGFKTLSDEERKVYTDKAQQAKERYAVELAEQEKMIALHAKHLGTVAEVQQPKAFRLTTELVFPLARIKRTMKLDPEVKNIKPEAAMSVGKALELFLAFMAVRVGHIATKHKRRTVKDTDVVELIHQHAAFNFLRKDFPQKPKVSSSKSNNTSLSITKRHEAAAMKAAEGTSKITGFFQRSSGNSQNKDVSKENSDAENVTNINVEE